MQVETRERIANLTSNILNPFLVSLVIILMLSFASTSSALEALKWSLISIAIGMLPVLLVIIYLVRKGSLDDIFINVREQRTKIFWLGGACGGAGCAVLLYYGAPTVLVAAFVAGLSAAVIFMCINLWWKVSLHTAFMTTSVTVLVIFYGWVAAVTALLIPLVSWSRVELKHHSLSQVVGGTLLGALIVIVVFSLFDLV